MPFTPEQNRELQKPLDPKHVVKPSGQYGAKGDYIEGWHAIAEANRIFGHGGWSYRIDLTQDSLREGKDSKGNPQWQAAYTCVCTVEAGGATRQDVGFGSGFAKQIGDAIEGATKEAATDALKRALRTFGHPFGLALYDKSRAHVQAPPPELSDGALRMIDAIEACDTVLGLTQWLRANQEAALANPDAAAITDRWNARKAEVQKMDSLAA